MVLFWISSVKRISGQNDKEIVEMPDACNFPENGLN